jgi:hypothetical protein
MAEESGRAAGETTDISRRLTELVGDFRLVRDPAPNRPAGAAKRGFP